MDDEAQPLNAEIPQASAGLRLDQALAVLFPQFSRSQIQAWIRDQRVRVDGRLLRQRDPVAGGEQIEIRQPPPQETPWLAQPLDLDIVFEDTSLLVVNKPHGVVVHPGAGNPDRTLVNGLIHYDPTMGQLPRAGIVHRLDKDTSGLLVVARNEMARRNLIDQLKERSLKRQYLAVVRGVLVAGGTVEAPIGRHRRDRLRMAVTSAGKPAITHYRVKARYRVHSLLRLSLETGRTHQIRVHMTHIDHSIVGDPVYGGRLAVPKGADSALIELLRGFRRQALHAETLGLVHPESGESIQWSCPLPDDMQALVTALAADADV
ncbi:MAG TPA: 23S rRNA pseudouridine(1911/1915/1917) synthase RluD [Acidiferrobacteraceae bacterium]|nr:23S rRNA pseudouridine(1911/1915/1917) synthase RluD [Acidiferrobacteraceae bacterium]